LAGHLEPKTCFIATYEGRINRHRLGPISHKLSSRLPPRPGRRDPRETGSKRFVRFERSDILACHRLFRDSKPVRSLHRP
jgi:hypothetical protein